jgi:hypothetical protein
VHQIPLARAYAKGLDLFHLEESMSWKAESSDHLVPLRPAARVARDGATAEAGTGSRRLLARAPGSRRSGATQANSRVVQRPQATRGGLMISHLVAFLDGREPNTSPSGGRLEEASTASCQLNRIRRA